MDENVIYCTSCGAANEAGVNFCFKCGKPIGVKAGTSNGKTSSDFITLTCPTCGGKLEITPDVERFACKFCGNEHYVQRNSGSISLAPMVESLKRVEGKFDQVLSGSDRAVAEKTIQRLKDEMPAFERSVAQKQSELKNNSRKPKNVLPTILISIPIPALLFLAGGCVFGIIDDPSAGVGVIILWISVILISLGLIVLCVKGIGKIWRRKYPYSEAQQQRIDKIQEELDKAQVELSTRREQLAKLHQYTAER